ncbi:cystatin-B-like [Rhinatrema bivittatum]|uniref:cystatin-B-like n=1 Tax=Rhinatrema bivittatum TaxID=194408 RepID=UPI00112DB614|nr:cystatin-B-like [Rhinatrema bivittatum]
MERPGLLLVSWSQVAGVMLCGGTGAVKPANADTQAIVDEVRPQYEAKEGKNPMCFKLISYRTQVVAGTNYFCKVQTGDDEYAHLCIYKTLPYDGQKLTLTNYQTCKTEHEEISYF